VWGLEKIYPPFCFFSSYHLYFSLSCFHFQRGKFYPQLTNLVRINTPKAVQTESRKAFKKLPNLDAAVATLTNLKGVGTTLASGVTPLPPPSLFSRLLFFFFCLLNLLFHVSSCSVADPGCFSPHPKICHP
jgi:hypothetical protein